MRMRRPRLLLHGSLVSRRLALRRRLYRRLAFHRLLCRGLMRQTQIYMVPVTAIDDMMMRADVECGFWSWRRNTGSCEDV